MVKHVQNATSPVSPPNKQHGCSTSLVKLVSPGKVLQIILYLGGEKSHLLWASLAPGPIFVKSHNL